MPLSSRLEEQLQQSMDYSIYWSCFEQRDEQLDTGWRILPYWVLLYTHAGETDFFQNPEAGHAETDDAGVTVLPVTVVEGELLLIPAGIRHRLLSTGPTVCDGLHINYRLFQSIDLLSLFEVPSVVGVEQVGPLRSAIQALTCLLQDNTSAGLQRLAQQQACAYELLYQLLLVSRSLPERERPLQSIGRIQNALTCIDEHLDQPLRVEALASRCSMSRNRFTALFKTIMGLSPRQYLAQKRLTRAMSLLANSEQPIASIAESLSFCDQFHFSRWFKKATGESPRSYREKIKAGLFR
ncbi:MAG: AraC family transcriptional regulator [Marinobacterium sp.]|nr:AraC family transcriptional regulator [Marinobacterium sp.]